MTPAALRSLLTGPDSHGRELAVLDVRSPLARSRGHLARSSGVPLHGLEERVTALVPRRSTPVVLASDPDLDAWAARVLAGLGYDDVSLLDGGAAGWAAAGERLHTGSGVRPKTLGEQVERDLGTPTVDAATVEGWRAAGEDVVVLDARPHAEYVHHHVPGGLDTGGGAELALRALPALAALPATTRVVVNCAGRTRGIVGAQTLRELGVVQPVHSLHHGLPAWGWAGLDVESGAREALPAPGDVPDDVRARARAALGALGVPVVDLPVAEEGGRTTYLVDVRSPAEHAAGVVAGARGIQGGQLVQATDDHLAVLGARVVLVDSDDLVRAATTARWLRPLHDGPLAVAVHDPGLVGPSPAPPAPPAVPVLPPGTVPDGDDLVLDLRTSAHYREGHLPGAVLSRRDDLPALTTGVDGRVVLVGGGGLPAPEGHDLQAPPRHPVEAAWAAAELRGAGVDAVVLSWSPDLPATTDDERVAGGEVVDHVGPPDFGPARDAWYRDYFAWEHALLDLTAGDPDFAFDLTAHDTREQP
ncbi:rhodanese-like domain-containing protein [Nocardioides sp. CFH 31398]|uniref:rhodanese-like domain-containing protein n=1 Tax=Nocardioides sp. CFH 31398 TaxID=2919579 RepID=UPI001F056F7F|nr:rhodanese-like domain-containing protein [Nocardioides sp. CFH 31398]MCH1868520.1 hypothetical protein [Nocardioides sp. CFH 31398]